MAAALSSYICRCMHAELSLYSGKAHALRSVWCCAGEQHCDVRYGSPKSVQIKASPQQSTPGLTPELCQLINAEVDVRRAASLDNVCDSSDLDTGDQLQVVPSSSHDNDGLTGAC